MHSTLHAPFFITSERPKLTFATKNSCNKWKVLYNNKKGDICYGEKGQTD